MSGEQELWRQRFLSGIPLFHEDSLAGAKAASDDRPLRVLAKAGGCFVVIAHFVLLHQENHWSDGLGLAGPNHCQSVCRPPAYIHTFAGLSHRGHTEVEPTKMLDLVSFSPVDKHSAVYLITLEVSSLADEANLRQS